MMHPMRNHGFTIIELMIVVAVVGLLAAIAYPTYTDSVRKSARGDAKSALTELSQFMTRVYTESKSYTPGGVVPTLPFTQAPRESSAKKYDLELDVSTSTTTFLLTATPINQQTNDSCGKLTINHLGEKGADGDVGLCW